MVENKRGPGRPKRTQDPKGRPARVPMSSGNRLQAPEREGYQRYWALEGPSNPGRLAQMQAAYWEFVLGEDGEKMTIPAGNGDVHYLMEIEQEYYDQDIAAQQARNIDTTAKQAQTLGEDEYVPMGKKSVVEREII